jgi:hypothetical protein
MAISFGRKNPRPVYKAHLALPAPIKSKPKSSFTSNRSFYACIVGAIAILIFGVVALQS